VAKSDEARTVAEETQETALVAAADQGAMAYYRVAGFSRLFFFPLLAGLLGAFARQRLHHQDYLIGSLAGFGSVFVLSMVASPTRWGFVSRLRDEAKGLRKTAYKLLGKYRARIGEAGAREVEEKIAAVDAALAQKTLAPVYAARNELDGSLDKHLSFARKSAAREYTESIGGLILLALLLRAFVFEPFHIPSGSMIPTLLVGDFIFVNKMVYGLRIPFTDPAKVHKIGEKAPQRGDVVVFIVPTRPDVDYVKRVIGLPGDRIEVQDNQVWVNGVLQTRTAIGDYTYSEHSEYTDSDIEVTANEYIEDLAGKKHTIITRKEPMFSRNGSFVVEPGRFFVMGDNRDNSMDSRVDGGPGQIPFSYIKGRASIIWISFGGEHVIRFERMFKGVN